MVTKYDIFEIVYKNRAPIQPIEVIRRLKKDEREYKTIYWQMQELVKEKLLVKTSRGFQAATNDKTSLLYNLIYYCLQNGVNYNLLLDANFAAFVSRTLQKKEINSKNMYLNPRTLRNYINILDKYGFVLIFSEKPLRAKIFYNILLNNLLVYFGYKHSVITDDSHNYLLGIEKELKIYRSLRKKNEAEYQKIVRESEAHFVHHSLMLEGNPITLPDTIKILHDKIIPANIKLKDVEEIKNYQETIKQMLKDNEERKPLNLQLVLQYHSIAMKHEPEIAGKIRTIPVHIKGNPNFKVSSPEKVVGQLNKLFDKYNAFVEKKKLTIKEILNFAVYFHNEFQHIHPFEDGNSRTTRLITFYLLQSKDIPILDIPFGLLDEYLSSTKGSKKREDEKLYKNLQKIILYNLKQVNKKLA